MTITTGQFGRTVRSRSIFANDRLDASYFADAAMQASERVAQLELSGVPFKSLGDIANVWDPSRFARVWAAPLEDGVPYLRPYDVFDYLPTGSDRLSSTRNRAIESLSLKTGTILQTCSGRNLGPCTIVDEDLADFSLSHDMIRIEIDDEQQRLFILAYLQTNLGQALLKRGRSGSVIDHLTVGDVNVVPVPDFGAEPTSQIHGLMSAAVKLREAARRELRSCLASLAESFPMEPEAPTWTHWTTYARDLTDRLDAGYQAPLVGQARSSTASGVHLGELAVADLPVRYKRYYVEGSNGRPIVSGRQLLQCQTVNLRRVSDRSFDDPEVYVIREGMTIFGAVGRAEGRQAWPALVTDDRSGWMASNDVMRLTPRDGVRAGALWLAVASQQAQVQIKALSFGSVVDHMNPWDVEKVTVPIVDDDLVNAAEAAWQKFADANHLAQKASFEVERLSQPS